MSYGSSFMMGTGSTFAALGFLTWLVWFVAGILLVVWLWQQINNKGH